MGENRIKEEKIGSYATLKDIFGEEIFSGQIMSRVVANEEKNEKVLDTRRVIVPKSITSQGYINEKDLSVEKLKVDMGEKAYSKRIAEVGDIVLKLSTPYDAALIDEKTAGCLVPSFCAIAKSVEHVDKNYLLAFLNSSSYKDQLKAKVAGETMTIMSINRINDVKIPVPDEGIQENIGEKFIETQEKIKLMDQIVELETLRNNIVFKDLEK